MTISNDSEFKAALSFLSGAARRLVAARFAENVLTLGPDPRVKGAIDAAKRADITAAELAAAYQSARTASVESFTRCGSECNWNDQASHFVAEAGVACVQPDKPGANPAWMPRCKRAWRAPARPSPPAMALQTTRQHEQYRILAEFLNV